MMDKRFIVGIVAVLLLLPVGQAATLEFFSKPECKPCENAKEYLDNLEFRLPGLEIVEYNGSYLNGSDFEYFKQTAARLRIPTDFVPLMVMGNDYHIGFVSSKVDGEKIKTMIMKNLEAEDKPVEVGNQTGQPDPTEGLFSDNGPTSDVQGKIVLKLFWGVGCPHCAAEKEFLNGIAHKYPQLVIETYEVNYNYTNQQLLFQIADELDFEVTSVPVTVIGDWYLIGYNSDEIEGAKIESRINGSITDLGLIVQTPFGIIDLREMGVPLSTVVIGLIDGFNPCAFFVLTMLLSFMVYAKSRKRMLLIGLTFVFISGFVYFIFMAAIFSAIRALNEIRLLAIIGGVIALIIGALNVKDFFFFKKGLSLSIPEDKKPKLYKRMRDLIKVESLAALMIGTIVLAFVANSYELLCTAGLPLVYGNLLNSQMLDTTTSLMYILLYNVFYVMPLLAIVIVFSWTLGGRKLSQEEGELLKGISGFMMLGFGIFLLVDPLILQNIFVTGSLIGIAIILSYALSKLKKRPKAKEEPEEGGEEEKKPSKKSSKKKKKDESAEES